jgi:CheY-like chemotaxis protein
MSAAPLRVLVVDDEPPIIKLLRMGLTAQGYQVLEAPNGKIALDFAANTLQPKGGTEECEDCRLGNPDTHMPIVPMSRI